MPNVNALLDRVPPQSAEAEQAALGAMLLEREAIVKAAELLVAEDFYRETHRILFRGILELFERNEPVDLVTLGEWLRAREQLDGVGGTLYLTELMHQTPTAAGIGYYATIIHDMAVRRQLIKTADEMLTAAYVGDRELDDLLAESEEKVFALVERRQTGGPTPMPDVYDIGRAAIDARRRADIDGFDVGFKSNLKSLNRILQPIKPGEMVVVAGRPSMGKSAIAMQLAIGAAEQGARGIFFSLEMDQDSLAMRLLLSHGLDNWKANSVVYRVNHPDEVYGALEETLETMRALPLRVVDTPALRPQDILHLGRRVRYQGGLDFVVVDYLQLMDANRHHEETFDRVRAVSRELKALAKSLKVAVIAVSQLSRGVETRMPPRPMMSDLRECVTGDTGLIDARTGCVVPIAELQPGASVLGVTADQRIVPGTVAKVWSTGVKPVWTVTTRAGRTLTATANHPLLTAGGWKPLGELGVGDILATAMRLPAHGAELPARADRCRLLGYLTGDGSYQRHRAVSFISADPDTFADAVNLVETQFPSITTRTKTRGRCQEAFFSEVYANGYGKPYGNALREWLREIGNEGERDSTKRVPRYVFEAGAIGAREFLAGYLATDGSVYIRVHGKAGKPDCWGIAFMTTSLGLARDVQLLLLKLGLVATIDEGAYHIKSTKPIYRIALSSAAQNLRRIVQLVPTRGAKGALLRTLEPVLPAGETNPGIFALPPEVSQYLAARAPWRDQRKRMRRSVCQEWAERLQDDHLAMWAQSDLLWEEITRIEPAGEQEVWDVSVPDCSTFLANGIVAHNSAQIEQDADKILLLYRPGYYGKKALDYAQLPEGDTHSTELILAKQRNGPTDAAWVQFEPKRTWFTDPEEEA